MQECTRPLFAVQGADILRVAHALFAAKHHDRRTHDALAAALCISADAGGLDAMQLQAAATLMRALKLTEQAAGFEQVRGPCVSSCFMYHATLLYAQILAQQCACCSMLYNKLA